MGQSKNEIILWETMTIAFSMEQPEGGQKSRKQKGTDIFKRCQENIMAGSPQVWFGCVKGEAKMKSKIRPFGSNWKWYHEQGMEIENKEVYFSSDSNKLKPGAYLDILEGSYLYQMKAQERAWDWKCPRVVLGGNMVLYEGEKEREHARVRKNEIPKRVHTCWGTVWPFLTLQGRSMMKNWQPSLQNFLHFFLSTSPNTTFNETSLIFHVRDTLVLGLLASIFASL